MSFAAEGAKRIAYPAWLVYLDIEDDPLWAWTGTRALTFGAIETGDPSLDGKTFMGVGSLGDIGDIIDQKGGGAAVTLSIAAADPEKPVFDQIIANRRRWRKRRGVIWLSYTDDAGDVRDGGGDLLFTPKRKRTGRMNGLRFVNGEGSSFIEVDLEGYAASGSMALNTRWMDQREIDPNDKSQDYAHDLANKRPDVGSSGQSGNVGGGGVLGPSPGGDGERREMH